MQKHLFITMLMLVPACIQAQPGVAAARLEKGRLLAKQCLECHASPGNTLAGPLQGIRKIRSANYIYRLLKNPMVFADENSIAKKAFAKRGLQMPPFPDLSKADIQAILDYIDNMPATKTTN